MQRSKKEEELFVKFISNKKIIIVDLSPASSIRLKRLLGTTGAIPSMVETFTDFDQALACIDENDSPIVFANLNIKGKTFFQFIKEFKAERPNIDQSMFFLVTSNSSEELLVESVKNNIDFMFLRPYLPDVFKQYFIDVALKRVQEIESREAFKEKYKAQGTNLFQKTSYKEELYFSVQNCPHHERHAILWTARQDTLVKTTFEITQDGSKNILFQFSGTKKNQEFINELSSGVHEKFHVQATLIDEIYFFLARAPFKLLRKNTLEVSYPEHVWKTAKRKTHRYMFHENEQQEVLVLDERLTKNSDQMKCWNVVNLSSTGMCIAITAKDKDFFPPNRVISGIHFTFNNHQFNCSATVRWCNNASVKGAYIHSEYYVGLQFLNMPQIELSILNTHVLEKLFDYLTSNDN